MSIIKNVPVVLIITTLGVGLISTWTLPVWAANPGEKITNPHDQRLLDEVEQIVKRLNEYLPEDHRGAILFRLDTPEKVIVEIARLEMILKAAEGRPVDLKKKVDEALLTALDMLYMGRGETTPGDGTGWYLTKKGGPTGLPEIKKILGRGLLDEETKREFRNFVGTYDDATPYAQRLRGLKGIVTHSAMERNAVLDAIDLAPLAIRKAPAVPEETEFAPKKPASFREAAKKLEDAIDVANVELERLKKLPPSKENQARIKEIEHVVANSQALLDEERAKRAPSTIEIPDPIGKGPTAAAPASENLQKTLHELLEEQVEAGKISEKWLAGATSWVNNLKSNLYDESVKNFNDPKKKIIHYFGRDEEFKKMVDTLSKTEKGHILLTGKAGVGKTTLLKMLQDALVQGKDSIHDEKPPIILELPITGLTNESSPAEAETAVKYAKSLSKILGRRVILFVDEAHVTSDIVRNALKGYLTDVLHGIDNEAMVNMAWATTSSESRQLLGDSAFSRRFTELHIDEFNREDTIKLIKQASVPLWKKVHKKGGLTFDGIDEEAFDTAYRFGGMEQRHAGNPTGTKELLEAALTRKMNALAAKKVKGPFTLTAEDVRNYLEAMHNTHLTPGDPMFNEKFEKLWTGFRNEMGGNDGAMADLKSVLRDHFSHPDKIQMSAVLAFGPPGVGKSTVAELISKHFFNGSMLSLDGGEFQLSHEKAKLTGSPPGYVGSKDHLSLLTKFFVEHPHGGVIKLEEADYVHVDVIKLFTNMITDKKFRDAVGNEFDPSKYLIWKNTNIGQDLMLPMDAANKMNWEQYNTRRASVTEKAIVNGKPVERLRGSLMSGLFDQYMNTIVTNSNPNEGTSKVSQEAMKQKRRYKGIYWIPPNRDELLQAAHRKAQSFIKDSKARYGVTFEIPREAVEKALNIENYEVEKGYSYVTEQLQDKLFRQLSHYFGERGKTIHAHLEDTVIEMDNRKVPAQNLVIKTSDGKSEKFTLGAKAQEELNPWGSNPAMMKRIENFQEEMGKHVIGHHDVIADIANVLKSKSVDWNEKAVFTLLGTSGNGKTTIPNAIAKVLFNDEKALFTITNLNHPQDLDEHLRPMTGRAGAKDVTPFEAWFKSRQHAGGGVINLDELLSFIKGQESGKLGVVQALYEFLREKRIKIAGKYEDARGFVVVMTGNSLQELFTHLEDSPESEAQVRQILKDLNSDELVEHLEQHGLDAPKIERLGHIHVMGPLTREESKAVGELKLQSKIEELRKASNNPDLKIVIPDEANEAVIKRLSTVKLGMGKVTEGFDTLIFRPLTTMVADLQNIQGHRIQKIEMKIPDGENPQWFVNGKEVRRQGLPVAGGGEKQVWEFKKNMKPGVADRTPTIHDLAVVEKMKYTPELLEVVRAHEIEGHWMTHAMLTRENGAEFVSLIPGKGHLGYVLPKALEVADVPNLSSILKEMVELSAGHRAVFYHGSYARGGGNDGSARTAEKLASDDLGRIEKLKKVLINNRMLPGITEASSPEEKAFVGKLLDNVVDRIADEVIHKGIESKQFQPASDKVMKDRYLNKEALDEFVKKVDFEKFGYHGKDALFMETLSASLAHELDSLKNDSHFEQAKRFSNGLLVRTFSESLTRATKDPKAVAELNEIKSAVVSKVKEGKDHPRMQLRCLTQKIEELF